MAYATLAQLKEYLDIPVLEIGDDDLLDDCLLRAQAFIDGETRRHFEATTETRVYNALTAVEYATCLFLDEDLLTLTTATNGDGADVTADTVLLPANIFPKYAIVLTSGVWTYQTTPYEAISIEGTWGWSVTAPADINQATVRLAAFLYKQKDAAAVDVASYYEGGVLTIPGGAPAGVKMIIGRNRRRET